MGTIRITETSRTGELSSTVEYEFSDFQDYISWRNLQSKRLKDSQADIVDISVGKKKTEPTKH